MESKIQFEESGILLMIGIRNLSVTDNRNPVLRILGMKSRIQDLLGLPFMRRVVVDDVFFFLNLNSIIDVL